ncbi:MAG: carboxypeptidase regulatory-like domain-containing protein [Myxococcota bacterium]
MELGEGAVGGGGPAPAPAPPPAPTTGTVEITVNLEALCWDTFDEDGNDADRPLPGASVVLPGHGSAVITDDNGLARFENVNVGGIGVVASKTDYTNGSGSVTVAAGATVTHTLTLRSTQLVCTRKHLAPVDGTPGTGTLGPMFWESEPAILVARDAIWVAMMLLTIAFTIVGLLWPVPAAGGLAAAVICFGIFAFANHIIFGLIPGVIVLVLAFLSFLGVGALTILALMDPLPIPLFDFATGTFGLPPANVIAFPAACALWVGFAVGLAAGRQAYSHKDWWTVVVATIVAALTAVGVFLVMFWFHDKPTFQNDPWSVFGFCCAQLVAGAIAGFVAGLMGHVFINDGNFESLTSEMEDLKLPYAGERYCVQGFRGFISHFHRSYEYQRTINTPSGPVTGTATGVTDEEYSYDFAVPGGTPILAVKEGHIIAFREDRAGNVSSDPPNETANYVYVQHRDGTVAHYLHLRPGGFSTINAALVPLATSTAGVHSFGSNPVHCHVGQQLGAAGNTGNSMFDHIHFAVKRAAPVAGRDYMPVTFDEPDVAIHDGRCYSMRKYRSTNVDGGPVSV